MRTMVIAIAFSVCVNAIASASNEFVFPPGTKLMPAKKVHLILSEEEYAELDYPSRPCVLDDLVNMIPGENIFVEGELKGNRLVNLKQVDAVKNPERTIELEFTQNQDKKSPFMVLKIKNPFERGLKYQAGIQYHGREGVYKTSTVVVSPKLVSFESWPNPLTRILMKNFELVDPSAK